MRVHAVLALLVLTAARLNAATLTVSTDKPVYLPGETVTITAVGNSGGAVDYWMFGSLTFDTAALLNPTAIMLTPASGSSQSWISGGARGCSLPGRPGECWIINHIALEPLGMDPIEQTLATITGTAGTPGSYGIEWSEIPGSGLYFFGLESGPGANLVIVNTTFQVIPEPAAALLLGLGLAGLASQRRRASGLPR
jgi:hypothetical protein